EHSEKVKGLVCVPGHQYDGEEAEETAEHSSEAVPGLSVHSTGVVDLDFANAKTAIARQHRNISMPLALYHHLIQHFFPIALKPAVDVVKPHTCEHGCDPVVHPGGNSAGPFVVPLVAPSRDQVVTLLQLLNDLWQFFRYVLKISVHCCHKVVFRSTYSGRERGRLAEVASEPDVFHIRIEP